MRHSKAFSLITHLPPKARKIAAERLKNHKREQLFALYSTLEKATASDEEPVAEEIYKKVFGKKYEKAKDYLLRNEYRLLYEELKELALQETFSQENSVGLLQYLLENGAHELFEEELNEAWRKAEAEDDVEHLSSLTDLKIKYLLNNKTQALGTAQELATLSLKRIAWLQTIALREIRQEEVRLKLAERLLQVYKQDFEPYTLSTEINLKALEEDDAYAQYLSKRAHINAARGNEKIKLLHEILELKETIEKYEANADEAICRFLINLAQEYYLQGMYNEAVTYYSQAVPHIGNVPKAVSGALAYNYVLALMRAEKFDHAKATADEYRAYILTNKVNGGRGAFLFAILSIYAGKADDAEQYIQLEAKKDGSEFYHFMRLALAMVYYLRGQADLALRECVNLDQAVNYELNREATLQTHITKPIITDFKKFYTIINAKLPVVKHKAALKKLSAELQQAPTVHGDQSPDSVLKQWLIAELNKIIN